jgi:hypothetical protein
VATTFEEVMNPEHFDLVMNHPDKIEEWRLEAWSAFRATPEGRRFVSMFPEYIETDPLPPPGRGLDLRGADLSSRAFSGFNLGGVKLDKANLTNTLFYECFLTEACFKGATLSGARFHHSVVRQADLSGVSATAAAFGFADLNRWLQVL